MRELNESHSSRMECRSSGIKIYPPMGKKFNEDGNFAISNWRLRSPIWDIRSSELDAKRPYREVPYCIDTYWNSGKLRGRVSLMRSEFIARIKNMRLPCEGFVKSNSKVLGCLRPA
ncbi:hypothetical protein TNCV_4204261 [Trichonephila clavipes]|nr:hypothetical protein TNCV_4204261 [Trichonephila clavipes]